LQAGGGRAALGPTMRRHFDRGAIGFFSLISQEIANRRISGDPTSVTQNTASVFLVPKLPPGNALPGKLPLPERKQSYAGVSKRNIDHGASSPCGDGGPQNAGRTSEGIDAALESAPAWSDSQVIRTGADGTNAPDWTSYRQEQWFRGHHRPHLPRNTPCG